MARTTYIMKPASIDVQSVEQNAPLAHMETVSVNGAKSAVRAVAYRALRNQREDYIIQTRH